MQRKDISRRNKSQNGMVAGRAARRGMRSRRDRALDAAIIEALESRQMLTVLGFTGTIQTYTAPQTGLYVFSVAGAQGGGGNGTNADINSHGPELPGGLGAVLTGYALLTAGTQLEIVVGGEGGTSTSFSGYGGGGGSFVFINGAAQPLIAAGGGGGDGNNIYGNQDYAPFGSVTEGRNAMIGTSGGGGLGFNSFANTVGGQNGGGGSASQGSEYGEGAGAGGAGWLSNGATFGDGSDVTAGKGGFGPATFAGGAAASVSTGSPVPNGGFGGGGGGGTFGGGGGGGYSGGGAGGGYEPDLDAGQDQDYAGGGGSYFDPSIKNPAAAVTQTGNGSVSIVDQWLAVQPDSIPLTDLSLPGTYASASGPSVQDALMGAGAENVVNPPSLTNSATTNAALAAHLLASADSEAAILAGGSNQVLNAAAIAANAAATVADAAAGITQTSSGNGLYIGLAADVAGVAGAIAAYAQSQSSTTTAAVDKTAAGTEAAVDSSDSAAAALHATAGGADATAGVENAAAGADDATAGALDATASATDAAAGGADTAAGVADTAAAGADVVAAAEAGFDPVADGIAAGFDTAGTVADVAATGTDAAAAAVDGLAGGADGVADGLDALANTDDGIANGADATGGASDAAAAAANLTAGTDFGEAASKHAVQGINDGISAAGYVLSAASDSLTAQAYGTFAAGIHSPDTTGGNSNNIAYQMAIYGLAVTEATAHSAAAAAETAAAGLDSVATTLNGVAVTLDNAAVAAVEEATLMNAEALAANEAAMTADSTAEGANTTAAADNAAALAVDATAGGEDALAGGLDLGAGVADGVAAGEDIAATVATSAAIALDAVAAATVEIPFVDIGTAAAAAAADGIAVGLDLAATATDAATAITDEAATATDIVADTGDFAVTADDAAATAADATATLDDAAATAADEKAAAADAQATAADEAAEAAVKAAETANTAADTADTAASVANHAAAVAGVASASADVAFNVEVQNIQAVQVTLQTQTLDITGQLNDGIRALDLRGALVNDNINLNAGQDFTGFSLQDAMDQMSTFLQNNPSETIVVSLSANEAAPVNSPNGFNADLNTLLSSPDTAVSGTHTYNDFVYYSSNSANTPTLGDVRGKIVFVPSTDGSWVPSAGGQGEIGWTPTQVIQNSHTETDPNQRWNDAESTSAGTAGLIPTDLGNPNTLYTNNLTQDDIPAAGISPGATPVELAGEVNPIAEQDFGATHVTRTTGIVGMDDPDLAGSDETLIDDIILENYPTILVTSDSDFPGDTGTLRDAILQADSQPGVSTIQFANSLSGSTGNVIYLQSNLPAITNDVNIVGSVDIESNGFTVFQNAPTHTVNEATYTASDSGPVTSATSSVATPLYVNTSGLTIAAPAPLTVDPINISYGTALTNSLLQGTATTLSNGNYTAVPGTFAFTTANGTVPGAGDGQSEAVTFTPSNTSLNPFPGTVIVNVARATATINTLNPVDITYGTALASNQLSGTASFNNVSVPGTFFYTSATGSVLHAGAGQTELVTFTPADSTDFAATASIVTVNVAQATPTVTSVVPVSITPGMPLADAQLSGTATFTVDGSPVNVPGTFTYTSALGAVPDAGNGQSEAVTFTPGDSTDYTTASSTVIVNVAQPTPVTPDVSVNAVNITYGTALANSQLTGSASYALGAIASVAGVFTYTTAAGTVLGAGGGQIENVTFTPADTADYTTVSTTVIVNVAQATPVLGSLNPIDLAYGAALAGSQIDGSPSVTGTFTFPTAAGSVLGVGSGQLEAVTFTPADATDYTTASSNVSVNVSQATPTITSVNAVNITYGTALANTQLSGTATYTLNGSTAAVPGTFTYTSAAGSVLNAGNGQSIAVTFTPNDTTDYKTVSSNVTVNVAQATPTVIVTDAGGAVSGSPFAATGSVTGVAGANLGTPTFTYYAATDVSFSNPLPGAPSALGRYVVVGSYAANGNYAVGAAITGFAIYTPPGPVNATITTAAQPATASLGSSIADKVTVTGKNPTGVVTFKLYNNATATAPALFTDTEPLTGGTATSKGFIATAATLGTDYWVATYCGDAANNPATTVANADPVTVSGSLVVNSPSDSPTATGNTLRDAVAYANTLGAGTHTITFDPTVFATSQTITLNSPLILSDVAGTTIITGPAAGVTLSGGNSVSLFNVKVGITATLSELTLIDGKSSSGGAIVDQGTLTITNSTLSGNVSTGLGGAIVVTGSLTIVNSTLASNSAAGSAGAIENVGSLTVLDSTLSANQAGSGGAIDNNGSAYTATIGDSIIAGNSASSAPNVSNAVTSQGNNLIGATDGSSGWVSSDLTGSVAQPLNPMLASLSNNGGPTQTMALLSTSPAIGAGASINGITTDQRGFGRPASSPDIGAYQSEAVVTVTDSGGVYNGSTFPATAASATGTGGLNDISLADFTFSYSGAGSTIYAASSTAPANAGTYTVTATYLGDATHASSSSLATPFAISKAASTTTVTDAGGTHNGSPFPATAASATGAGGLNDTNLADFTFSYAGTGSTTYAASSTAPTNAGTYTVTATYKGDTNHLVSSSTPLPFTIVGQTAPSITATAGATIVIGTHAPLSASATLSGAVNPKGSITFTLYSPSNKVVYTKVVKVTANGTYHNTASGTASGSAVPTAAGTYQWVATFSGDAKNKPAATAKGATPESAVGAGATVVGDVLYLVTSATGSSFSVTPIGSSPTGSSGILIVGLLNGSLAINLRTTQSLASIEYYGFNGNDSIIFANSMSLPATIIDGNGNDNVIVGGGDSAITLGNGNDSLTAGNGNNTITAGNGNNTIHLGSGNNTIHVGAGNNKISVGTGNNTITGGNGNNTVTAASIASGNGNVSLRLGNGNNTVNVGNGANTIQLGNGKNSISAGNGNNFISVGNGSDSILVGNGNNIVVGGTGSDTITAGTGYNLLIGGLGADSIHAGNGRNILIDGSVKLTHAGDTLQNILSAWIVGGSTPANVANIRSRIKVADNTTNSNTLQAGSGLDWFWYVDSKDLANRKLTDLLN